jgi:coenzyme F420-reducing hydrogenase delta subunit
MTVRITAFCCRRSGEKAAAEAKRLGLGLPGLEVIGVPCSGRVDVLHLLKAFEAGADGVMVVGCYEDACEFLRGNIVAGRRVEYVRGLLGEAGIDPERVLMVYAAAAAPHRLARTVKEFSERLQANGPRPGAGKDGE